MSFHKVWIQKISIYSWKLKHRVIKIEKFKKVFGKKFNCGDCAFGKATEYWPNLIDCKIYRTQYNIITKKICKRFKPRRIERNCNFCVFNTFYELALDYIGKNHLSTEFLLRRKFFQGYCSILDEFKCFPLKEPCPYHAYKLIELPDPFFHNNRICPYCDKYVKKGSRLQVGKKYQWFHVKCRRSSGINIMGFFDFKLELML